MASSLPSADDVAAPQFSSLKQPDETLLHNSEDITYAAVPDAEVRASGDTSEHQSIPSLPAEPVADQFDGSEFCLKNITGLTLKTKVPS